jgi:alcohol dehydrogenase class IV
MALVSLCGGLALANAKLGAVHGFAGPLGGMFPAPHGAVCGRLLPYVMPVNVRALQERAPDSPALRRYDQVAQRLTGDRDATADDGVAWVIDLCRALDVPSLSAYGMTPDDIPAVIAKAARSSSMRGNPIQLTPAEMEEILAAAL